MYFLYVLDITCATRHTYHNDEAFPCANFRTLLLLPDFLIFYTVQYIYTLTARLRQILKKLLPSVSSG